MRPATLLIFAKPARIGLSKTRLAKGLGPAAARRIAGFTLAHTLKVARTSGCAVTLCLAPDAAARASGPFAGMLVKAQGSGSLTERLGRGLADAPPGPVLFIGADAPGLTPHHLRLAVILLRRHDAVFGPARDGGFWLFGMHKRPGWTAPFAGVRWSGPHAMADVRARLPAGSRVGLMETLIDIDEAADWADWTRQTR